MKLSNFIKQKIKEGMLDVVDMVTLISDTMNLSKTKARKLIEQNAVSINGSRIGLYAILFSGDILKVGKRNFFKLK